MGRLVVLAPDVPVRGIYSPDCRRILELWRDGVLRPVVSSTLLRFYSKLLVEVGVPRDVLRNWLLWFTSPQRSLFLKQVGEEEADWRADCETAARLGHAEAVIVGSTARCNTETPEHWLTAKEFLDRAP